MSFLLNWLLNKRWTTTKTVLSFRNVFQQTDSFMSDDVVTDSPTAGVNYWQGNLSFYLIRVFTEILFNKNKGYIKHIMASVFIEFLENYLPILQCIVIIPEAVFTPIMK